MEQEQSQMDLILAQCPDIAQTAVEVVEKPKQKKSKK